MCGIVGMAAFHKKEFMKRKEFMKQGILASSLRGMDGTGMFLVPIDKGEELKVIKKPLPGYDFIGLGQVETILKDAEKYKFIVAHTRLRTRGDVTAAHTHPFAEGPITMVHNGMISNAFQVAGNKQVDVDSMAVAMALAATEDPKSVMESLEGAFALVWHDARSDALFLARNSERPLFFGVDKEQDIMVFASELKMLDWIASRTGIHLGEKRWDVGEDQIYMLTDSMKGKIFKFKKKAKPISNWYDRDNLGRFTPNTTTVPKRAQGTYIYGHPAKFHLNKIGLELGDEINFYFNEWQLKTNKSRHGTIIGTTIKNNWLEVEADGVAYQDLPVSTVLSGKITGARVSGEVMSLLLGSTVKKAFNNKAVVPFRNPVEDTTSDIIDVPVMMPGPIGPVEIADFNKLVEDGCASCSKPIFAKESSGLRWTVDGEPVCLDCSKVYKDSGALLQ